MRELEFLPEDYIRTRFHRRVGFIRSWLLLALGLATGLWSLQVGAWVREARAELQALRGAGFAVEADCEKVRMLQAEAETYNRRVAALKRLRPRVTVTEVVPVLVELLPKSIVLDEVCFDHPEGADGDRATLSLRGSAPTEVVIARALGSLEASGRFDRVVLAASRPQDREGKTFRRFHIEVDVVVVGPREECTGGTSRDSAQTVGR